MGLWYVWLPPWCCGCQKVWRAVAACGGLWWLVAACGGLWRLVPPDWMPLIESLETSMPDAWRPEASMPGCNVGWLAWLAGLAGWLGWLAAAGGLLLAGCCWLMEGSLTRSTLWGGRRILDLALRSIYVDLRRRSLH